MTAVLERTGSSLGSYEELSAQDEVVATRHTPVREVGNDSLRAVLAGFDSALPVPMAPLWTFVPTQLQSTGPDPLTAVYVALRTQIRQAVETVRQSLRLMLVVNTDTYPAHPPRAAIVKNPTVSLPGAPVLPEAHDVVNAVRHVEGRLGLPVRDVCEAADITRSTFYSWVNQEDSRPRLPSQGRLWALVQLVDDLEELLGAPPAAWLRANEEARALIVDGSFDDVAKMLRAQGEERLALATPEYAHLLSVGADRLESDVEPPKPPGRRRRVAQAQGVKPSHRRK